MIFNQLIIEIIIIIINYIILLIFILITVAFVTLIEQKVLSAAQIRIGPVKVGWWGILQPFADAVKLFIKETRIPRIRNLLFFIIAPCLSLFIVLRLWLCLPNLFGGLRFEFRILYFICVRGIGVFPIIRSGWSSNRKYSLLGGLRAVAQIISYEVSLAVVLLRVIILRGSFSFKNIIVSFGSFIGVLLFFPLCLIWFVRRLAETNRTPYDFSEGESELVSGFNTEYSAGGFTLIFIAEYASIIFIRILFCVLFLTGSVLSIILKTVLLSFIFFWVRATLPRYRYDKLIYLAWKRFLPIRLFILCYYVYFFYGIFLGNLKIDYLLFAFKANYVIRLIFLSIY